MNNVQLVGNLTKDVDLRYSQGENANAFARFTVACQRRFKNAQGGYDADFVSCIAFGKTAEFVSKYFQKGSKIGITGEIRTGNYTREDGTRVFTTDVYVNTVEFVGSKTNSDQTQAKVGEDANGFMTIPEGVDEELPFA